MERKDVYSFAVKILSMPNRSWFIIALNRLAELCKDEQEK